MPERFLQGRRFARGMRPSRRRAAAHRGQLLSPVAVYKWRTLDLVFSAQASEQPILDAVWSTPNQFVTCGVNHVHFWTKDGVQAYRRQVRSHCETNQIVYSVACVFARLASPRRSSLLRLLSPNFHNNYPLSEASLERSPRGSHCFARNRLVTSSSQAAAPGTYGVGGTKLHPIDEGSQRVRLQLYMSFLPGMPIPAPRQVGSSAEVRTGKCSSGTTSLS